MKKNIQRWSFVCLLVILIIVIVMFKSTFKDTAPANFETVIHLNTS